MSAITSDEISAKLRILMADPALYDQVHTYAETLVASGVAQRTLYDGYHTVFCELQELPDDGDTAEVVASVLDYVWGWGNKAFYPSSMSDTARGELLG